MSTVFASVRSGAERRGGVVGYPLQSIYEEVAFLAYHFHWAEDSILGMEHGDRRRWVKEISAINERRNSESENASSD